MNIPRLLYQLQEIDVATDAARDKVARIEAELAADSLAAEGAAIAKRQSDLKALQHELRENTAKADDFTAKIKLYEEKLYSGRINNPKELSTLQKDIDLLRGHRTPFEDKSLELMESIESAEDTIAKAEIAMQRHKEALEIHRRELSGQLKYLGAELADLEARRVALVADIPVDAEAQYQLLRKQKGKAVAKVEQGSCRGCGISVTAAWLHRARAGEIVRCTNCNRILHME
jgi:predicted  nucleic acid-binding Zn-ribbon protein